MKKFAFLLIIALTTSNFLIAQKPESYSPEYLETLSVGWLNFYLTKVEKNIHTAKILEVSGSIVVGVSGFIYLIADPNSFWGYAFIAGSMVYIAGFAFKTIGNHRRHNLREAIRLKNYDTSYILSSVLIHNPGTNSYSLGISLSFRF